MKIISIIGLLSCCITFNAFAAEQVVKEDTTPPPAETALTLEQLQPVLTTQPNQPTPTQNG